MKERPILFSAPMVRAILEGRKTQTRRVMRVQPGEDWLPEVGICAYEQEDGEPGPNFYGAGDENECFRSLYGEPGDRLWVREAYWAWGKWSPNGFTKAGRKRWKFTPVGASLRYQGDGNDPKTTAKRDGECGWVYRHARFMPKRHSRITLEITDVCVQRIQEISEEDARAEGCKSADRASGRECILNPELGSYRLHFRELWDSINAERGFGWDVNPWVWALTFKRCE